MRYTIRPLESSTWAAFAELAERNNGFFGGCWCMSYHLEGPEKRTGISHRAAKEDRVGLAAEPVRGDARASCQGSHRVSRTCQQIRKQNVRNLT